MLNVLVPLDFSEISFNAAHYAIDLYKNRSDIALTLYHFYKEEDEAEAALNYLESLKKKFTQSTSTQIETQIESGDDFIDSFSAFAHAKTAYMIVMGLTGKTALAQRFSGSNTLKMVEQDICPVLIVPGNAIFTSVTNTLILSEMKYVNENPVLLAVKRVLSDFKPILHILNVDESHYISLAAEYKEERDKMETLLSEFKPEFYFMRLYDFHEAVNLFTEDKKIDMIIIAPKKHSFYERLFKTQHTKKLIYQSKIPVLAIHE